MDPFIKLKSQYFLTRNTISRYVIEEFKTD